MQEIGTADLFSPLFMSLQRDARVIWLQFMHLTSQWCLPDSSAKPGAELGWKLAEAPFVATCVGAAGWAAALGPSGMAAPATRG